MKGARFLGAALGLWLVRLARPSTHEAPLRSRDVSTLALIVLLGGIAGPVLMLYGLERLEGITGSLLLNLEAPFTILLAVLFFREHLPMRALIAIVCILVGALLLKFEPGESGAYSRGLGNAAAIDVARAVGCTLTSETACRASVAS